MSRHEIKQNPASDEPTIVRVLKALDFGGVNKLVDMKVPVCLGEIKHAVLIFHPGDIDD